MWCNVGFADILFKDCGSKKKDGTFRQIKEGRKHEYYVSFKDGKIYKTVVYSIEDLKRIDEFLGEGFSGILHPTGAVKKKFGRTIYFPQVHKILNREHNQKTFGVVV